MSDNVIRHDVIKLDFDTNTKVLQEILSELKSIQKAADGTGETDGLDKLKKQVDNADDSSKKLKNSLSKVSSELGNVAKKAASISFKAITTGIAATSAAVGGLAKQSFDAYADLEQLKGGVETLFGAKGAKTVEEYAKYVGKDVSAVKDEYEKLKNVEAEVYKNANNAWKTAGLSANDYMSTVTGFSASLIQSLNGDTVKATKLADQALIDMADNANKMGTDMGSIQYAYQGFAKQNYTMLDNLKLGYGGTKSEMERLLKDAGKLANTEFKITSYADVIEAIHVIQENMGITGTTAKEAEKTITGSLNALKSTWGNLLPAFITGGEELDQCIDNFVQAFGTFLDNAVPAVEKALGGIGKTIEKLVPIIEKELPVLIDKLLPPLIKAATALFSGLITALPSIIKIVIKEIPNIVNEISHSIADAVGGQSFIEPIKKAVAIAGGTIFGGLVAFKGVSAFKSITSLFSSAGGAGESVSKGLNPFSSLAKANPKTILKGMTNLAIILGGLTILAAAFMKVAPYIAGLSDIKSVAKVAGVVSALGLVGTGLSALAGKIGLIPVATVAKGLANMAIMLTGLGALTAVFVWLSPKIMAMGDLKSVFKVAAVMTALGVVGSALSVFAGIAGMIPIPVVLAGLANMALVLGGITGVIVAFGALSECKGFTNFLDKGGAILVNISNTLGKMAGSLIGGLGEGIASSLPEIGKSLSEFAQSIKPMFTTFEGVDMSGIGTFLKTFGEFMLLMAGEKLLSVFTGKTNLADLGTQLSTFGEKSAGFFTKIATFPEDSFAKAKALFDCLAGIKGLPKEGGIKSWFTGDIAYDSIASGLGKLSGEKVINFFNSMKGLEQAGFDNAKNLFDCLAGMKSLPKEGGVVGWFSGKINYDNIATGLGKLAGDGVKSFFGMVSGFNETTFNNTKLLFETLSGIKALPKDGGFWQYLGDAITGKETKSALSVIATDLSTFSEKTETFFKQVNSLNLGKLNGLWKSLANADSLTTNLSKVVGDNIDDIVKKVSKLPKKMADGVKSGGKALADAFVSVWTDAVKASVAPVNKLLSGANFILKEFGSEKRMEEWKPYAKGTDGHKGGNALVNDGRGAELIQMPNGRMFIPNGRNVFLPNAPKGMKVLNAERTAALLGHKSPTFNYKDGTGDIDVWSYYDNGKGLISKVAEQFVNYDGLSGFNLNLGKAMVNTVQSAMNGWIDKVIEEFGAKGLESYVASAGVNQWKSTVAQALKMEGLYSAANVKRTLYQMQTESGGNPRAINLWDSNAKKGIPSKGLMQVIDPTFKAYARTGFNKNIYDPLSNILASVRYATSRYGSLEKAYQGHGYSSGVGEVTLPESSRSVTYTPENSYTGGRTEVNETNNFNPVFNLTISGTDDDRATARKVKQWVQEAIEEMFESMARRNATT